MHGQKNIKNSPIHLYDKDNFIFMYLGLTENFTEEYKHSVYIEHR